MISRAKNNSAQVTPRYLFNFSRSPLSNLMLLGKNASTPLLLFTRVSWLLWPYLIWIIIYVNRNNKDNTNDKDGSDEYSSFNLKNAKDIID